MHHPLQTTLAGNQRWLFWPLLCLTFIVMAVLNWIDLPLKTAAAPHGIVSFELAGDAANARTMLDSWDSPARIAAGFSLGFDYLFLCCYSTSIAFGCVWAATKLHTRFAWVVTCGLALAWGQWLAAIFDAVENYALLQQLFHGPDATWTVLAWWCAVLKFVLVILGLGYFLLGLSTWLLRRT
ncbi:hypothetical protein BH10PLA2_BH10PLA2_06300 [soil metagenome]